MDTFDWDWNHAVPGSPDQQFDWNAPPLPDSPNPGTAEQGQGQQATAAVEERDLPAQNLRRKQTVRLKPHTRSAFPRTNANRNYFISEGQHGMQLLVPMHQQFIGRNDRSTARAHVRNGQENKTKVSRVRMSEPLPVLRWTRQGNVQTQVNKRSE
jgi:hypothetical protein